jgi:Heparinase II/III-like protein.
MRNILLAPLSETELGAILAETAGRTLLPPLGDPAWAAARENPAVVSWLTPLIDRAVAEADEPLPELTDELYADFFRTGVRINFERLYFERRRRLGRAAFAVLLGDETVRTRLLPSFRRKLEDIFAETSWTLPASIWNEPSGKDPFTIDLFAAESANTFAELLTIFRAVIPDDLSRRIRERLRVQCFQNYLDRDPPFYWTARPTNWNAVCHQGVVGAALTIEDDHALLARLVARAAAALPTFLDGFEKDGASSEGPIYWAYGFGRFAALNARLEERSAGRLSMFEGHDQVARIARFGPAMCLSGGHLVNFSDGPRVGRLGAELFAYLGQRLGDPLLSARAAADYRHHAEDGLDLDAHWSDFFHFIRLALHAPAAETIAQAPEPRMPDVFFDHYGAVVVRGADSAGNLWEFAAKAGHNAEHHNHNDCGGFLLNLNGAPAFVEIGAPEYTRDYFNERRYSNLATRSLGHSVPFVNGREQFAGREAAASVLKAEIGGDRVEFLVDLARCYPAEARCQKLHRGYVLEKSAGRLVVTDTYELAEAGPVESVFICRDPVSRDGDALLLDAPGGTLRLAPAEDCAFTEIERCDFSGHRGVADKVHRLRLAPRSGPARSGVIRCEITVAAKTES